MTQQYIIGLDPGFDRLGFGIIQGGKAVEYGICQTDAAESFGARLHMISEFVTALVLHTPGQPVVGIETPFFRGKNSNAAKVPQVIGVILLALHTSGVTPLQFSPSTIKAKVANGKADKKQVKAAVESILGITIAKGTHDDATDGLAIAIATHLHLEKGL